MCKKPQNPVPYDNLFNTDATAVSKPHSTSFQIQSSDCVQISKCTLLYQVPIGVPKTHMDAYDINRPHLKTKLLIDCHKS